LREGKASRLHLERAHANVRRAFGIPPTRPAARKGVRCDHCLNACQLLEDEVGYCGMRANRAGTIASTVGEGKALVHWYHDPLPTNCVADWVCPEGSSASAQARKSGGSPPSLPSTALRTSRSAATPRIGAPRHNLAVFFYGCTFNCLFCQNWTHKLLRQSRPKAVEEFAASVTPQTACICFFGGDPTPQAEWAFAAAEQAIRRSASSRACDNADGRHLPPRICWETNGAMSRQILDRMIDLSLATGGCVKFDLKAFSPQVHRALCGVSNKRTLDNFAHLVERARERPDPPLAVASTLIVPAYVEVEEVAALARFIAELDPATPYSLLAFHPDFALHDLPLTSVPQAQVCYQACQAAGLSRVHYSAGGGP